MEKILNTDVLIIGAGPTGLMAANQLHRFGIDFIIIDKKEGPTRESRAILVTARSLEIYKQMGLAGKAITTGKIINSFNLYSGGKRKAKVQIGEIGKGKSEFSYMLAFEQSKNEELLSNNLTENGKEIHWNHEFVKISEYTNNITVIANHKGEEIYIKAKYLIGCDGARSPIRHQMNFCFTGGTYDHKFFVADTLMHWGEEYDKLVISPGEKNFCAFLPLYGDRRYRVLGTLPKEYAENESITFQDIESVIAHNIGIKIKFESVNWFSIYRLHHRCVDHFRKERVFLAGDSAHIHSPAGGQGMNTGLQDAYNLCWKLAFVLKGYANPALLDTYNEERLPFAKWLLKFTDRMFNMMTSDNWFIKLFRKIVALNVAGSVLISARVRSLIFKTLSQTGYSYKRMALSSNASFQKLLFNAGDRLPYFSEENIYPAFTGPSFHLLHVGQAPLNMEQREKILNLFPFTVTIVEDSLNKKWNNLGVESEIFILVRPDNYIAFIFDAANEIEIKKYLNKYFISHSH